MKSRFPQLQLTALATLCLLATTAILMAQSGSPATDAEKRAGSNYHSSFASAEFAFGARKVVRSAPYSATAEKETTQFLADGNRIVRRDTAYMYRDGEGRTRYDRFFGGEPRGTIATRARFIYDPTIGALYFFAPEKNIATKFFGSRASTSADKLPIEVVVNEREMLTSVVGGRTESLGTKIIEGVEAEGARTTTTIAAGEIGNKQPAMIAYERWYAPALGRNVLIKCTDTRFGEAVFRLTNINRSEPAPDVFALPPADQIREMGFDSKRQREAKPTTR